jgi:D-amino-acid dehydrogenase
MFTHSLLPSFPHSLFTRGEPPQVKVIVLGAGVVGVTSAWYLARAGHEVIVVDRQPGAGFETSFANGGQISVSHAEPWANPSAPAKILSWLGRIDAPLLFRPRLSAAQWSWGLRFLYECLPARTRHNTLQIFNLALYSRAELRQLRESTGIRYDHLERGILHLHSDPQELDAAHARVELMRALGFEMPLKTAQQCIEIEPALAFSRVRILGGTYSPSDECGDAHLFSRRLEQLCMQAGVSFLFQTTILRVLSEGGSATGVHIRHVEGPEETLRGDAYLVCLGSFAPHAVAPLGIRIPVYPVKGYSLTFPIQGSEGVPQVCLTDESAKLAISPLGNRLRVAGTAELGDYDAGVDIGRCKAILARVEQLFPRAGNFDRAQPWAGLRPTTPGNVPIIGRTRFPNLFLNTGHGTLGWTLACGSGRAIADIVSGRTPEVEFAFQGF